MTTTQKEVRANKRAAQAPARKALIEKIKTAVIFGAVMIGIGFYAGNVYANNQHADMQSAVKTAVNSSQTLK